MDVTRRSFLQVVGLSVATNSIFTEKTEAAPTQQNPETITTGFPSIDEATEGGWRKGTINMVYANKNVGRSLLLQSMAIKAATDLRRPASVLYVTERRSTMGNERTPFDGCMTILDINRPSFRGYDPIVLEAYQYFRGYDLIVFESKEIAYHADTPYLSDLAQKNDCAVVVPVNTIYCDPEESCMTETYYKVRSQYRTKKALENHVGSYPSTTAFFHASIVLAFGRLGGTEDEGLGIYKNRWGKHDVAISLKRPSAHLLEEDRVACHRLDPRPSKYCWELQYHRRYYGN